MSNEVTTLTPTSFVLYMLMRMIRKETSDMAVSTRTDEDIQLDVLEELRWDTRVHPNEIGVSVKDGVVTLTG